MNSSIRPEVLQHLIRMQAPTMDNWGVSDGTVNSGVCISF